MRKILCVICLVSLLSSCRKNIDVPSPEAELVLKRTVQTDIGGAVMRVSHYNEHELVTFDTIYMTGTLNPGMIYVNTYNTKGRRTLSENTIPILYTAGVYWKYQDYYQDDTLPTLTYRYLKGNQVAEITHFYNAAKQLVLDSTYHTPNFGTFTYLNKFEYDVLGRLIKSTDLNDTRDTTSYTTYQYFPNRVEKWTKTFNYNPVFQSYSLAVTEYTSSGKISSEKVYGGQVAVLSTQTDYTYDATDHLLNKTITTVGSPPQEERYFNNSTTGQPERMESFINNQLRYTVTYFYE